MAPINSRMRECIEQVQKVVQGFSEDFCSAVVSHVTIWTIIYSTSFLRVGPLVVWDHAGWQTSSLDYGNNAPFEIVNDRLEVL